MSPTASEPLNVYQNVVRSIRDQLPEHLRKWHVDEHGCWIWEGHRQTTGWPGATSAKGWGKGNAYRLIWQIVNDQRVPEGKEMDHVCGRGRFGCVNPFHIVASDHKTNIYRSAEAVTMVNARKTHCINGHELTPDNVGKQTEKAGGGRECLTCRSERNRRWVKENRDRANELSRASYWRNHDRSLELAAKKRERRRKKAQQQEAS